MKRVNLLIVLLFIFLCCESNKPKIEKINDVWVTTNPKDGIWQNVSPPPISLKLEKVFGKENEPDEEIFAHISNVFTDIQLNVYIYDFREERLVCFDKNGGFRWDIESAGSGPGDLSFVKGMVYDGHDKIYMANLSGNCIDRFNTSGKFETRFNLENLNLKNVELVGYIQPNILVVIEDLIGKAGENFYFLQVNDSLSIKRTFLYEEDLGIDVPFGILLSHDIRIVDDQIAVANFHAYEIDFLNFEGKRLKKVIRKLNKVVRPGFLKTSRSLSVRLYSIVNAPMKLTENYLINSAYWPTNLNGPDEYLKLSRNKAAYELKYESSVDFFNAKGELLYSMYSNSNTPEIGRPMHVDADGKLYTVATEPFPQVRRYEMIFNR